MTLKVLPGGRKSIHMSSYGDFLGVYSDIIAFIFSQIISGTVNIYNMPCDLSAWNTLDFFFFFFFTLRLLFCYHGLSGP